MFGKIRTIISKSRLMRSLSRTGREPRMVNLAEARRIGIVYVLNDIPDYDSVSAFVSELQHDHKDVKALGFVRNKSLIGRFLPKLSYDFFSRRDISWLNVPTQKKVRDFIDQEFDLLIDLSMKEVMPIRYIAGHSRAHCRVGKFTEENTCCYDLMIDIGSSATLDEFIIQIKHYLTVINQHAENSGKA